MILTQKTKPAMRGLSRICDTLFTYQSRGEEQIGLTPYMNSHLARSQAGFFWSRASIFAPPLPNQPLSTDLST